MSGQQRQTKRIAVFTDWIDSYWHKSLISGISDYGSENNIDVITLVGGNLENPIGHEMQKNLLFNFTAAENMDGILVFTPAIGRFSDQNEIAKFLNSFEGIPKVSIATEIEGIPSILVDNRSGMREMMNHLIQVHGFRRIFMIRGPVGIPDADIRFAVYKEMLDAHGIRFDPDLVMESHFGLAEGFDVLNQIFEKDSLSFDALIAANDDMAIGIIEKFKEKGYDIPLDIPVLGFDDIDMARLITPHLTTVRQSFYRQGYTAARLLHNQILGREVPLVTLQNSQLIVRESCGCLPALSYTSPDRKEKGTRQKYADLYTEEKEDWIKDMLKLESEVEPQFQKEFRTWVKDICESLNDSITDDDPKLVLLKLKAIINYFENEEFDVNFLNKVVSILYSRILSALTEEEEKERIESLFRRIWLFLNDAILSSSIFHSSVLLGVKTVLSDIERSLDPILPIEDQKNVLQSFLPRLNIRKFYLCLYKDPKAPLEKSVLIFDMDEVNKKASREEIVFPTMQILPSDRFPYSPYNLVVESLFFGDGQIGFLVIDLGYWKGRITDTLRTSLSNSIKRTLFMDDIQQYNQNLENQVRKRTQELESTNIKLKDALETLKKAQDELIQSEKMAALGNMVAGMAHEINTPIGISMTAASHLETETKELNKLISANKLKKSDLEKYIEKSMEAAQMVMSNLRRAAELIRSLKNISVDQSNEQMRTFNVREYIGDILNSLRPRLKRTLHRININCPDDLKITSYPGLFSQILTNLILNSLIHGFDKIEKGEITIDLELAEDFFLFTYADNGKGIDGRIIKRIFEPFFTTKRNKGGTGLGLHLVYTIVTQRLSGVIKCDSRKNEGARFSMIFPLLNNKHMKLPPEENKRIE
ncbi:MAG: substrate-binding domain-containing protein [Spirochaetales bacterium]|nr:substrate-binding domain-containing protein [Spirochaetales bacterium]